MIREVKERKISQNNKTRLAIREREQGCYGILNVFAKKKKKTEKNTFFRKLRNAIVSRGT
jgi:hypothetical protein